ncbi:MAG: beta-lactamase family protein [Nocardiopsaceae bacterium]|nr:beta-lactamase family protein [Nocardiopsaceae bacterium]
MDSDSVRGIGRRRLLGWGGLAAGVAAGASVAGMSAAGAQPGRIEAADDASVSPGSFGDDSIPPGTRPGGAYDRYVAGLAAKGQFSGVVLLSHRGRTVLSSGYGMADKEKRIGNGEGIAYNLSSAGKPFGAVAMLQLAQQGKVRLSDTVGTHLTGFATDVAEQVTIHQLLSGSSGLSGPDVDPRRIFYSREEVRDAWARCARQSKLTAPPGTTGGAHEAPNVAIPAMIIEAVTSMTYWDYVQENVFGRCGMTGSAFCTRPQWLTDPRIAQPYMTLADGSVVDAVRHLEDSSPNPETPGVNPGRTFIDAPGNAGFVTAPDLVRFARALGDGTLLDRPYADLFTGAKFPLTGGENGQPAPDYPSFGAYDIPVNIIGGQWVAGRAGADPGIAAYWHVYQGTGWVGVILANIDNVPLGEMGAQEVQAITGQPASGGGVGGG